MEQKKIILVEDDWIIAKELAINLQTLGFLVPEIIESGEDFLAKWSSLEPVDLVILDIDLAGELTGLDIARFLHQLHIPFLFLTAQADHQTILEAKWTNPQNYLIKPVRPESLFSAVEIALHNSTIRKNSPSLASENHQKLDYNDALFVKAKKRLEKIKISDILWIEAKDIYVLIVTAKDSYILSVQLKNMEERLPSSHFMRVHRSFIVQIDQIEAIEESGVRIGQQLIPVGKTHREKLMNQLKFL